MSGVKRLPFVLAVVLGCLGDSTIASAELGATDVEIVCLSAGTVPALPPVPAP